MYVRLMLSRWKQCKNTTIYHLWRRREMSFECILRFLMYMILCCQQNQEIDRVLVSQIRHRLMLGHAGSPARRREI